MQTIPDRRLSEAEVQDLQRPLINDLLAYYRLVSDAAVNLLDKAVEEGWTPERLIDELDRMIAGDNRAPETVAVPGSEDVRVNKARRLDGRMDFQGLPVSIENAAGSTRSGVDSDGHPWSITMLSPYGYVRGTEGVDGDAVDVYVGDNPESQLVFVVHIKNPNGTYDEDKCMIGYNSEPEARKVIETHYDRDVILSIETMTLEQFRKRLDNKPGKKITAPKVAKEASMSVPKPKSGEAEQDYVSRVMGELIGPGHDQSQAAAIAHSEYRSANKAMSIGGFESPEPGDIPEGEKKLLADVYAQYRKKGMSKEESAKRAWGAVHSARKEGGSDTKSRFFALAEKLGVDPTEFYNGVLTEAEEHDLDYAGGAKIALDHLRKEDPAYYSKLKAAGL